MDIAAWLSNVGDAADQSQASRIRSNDAIDTRRAKRRVISKSSSNSTLSSDPPKPSKAPKRVKARAGNKKQSRSSVSDVTSSAQPSVDNHQSETFERRPRRKTRPDIYEPNSGARKRRSKAKKDNNPKKQSKREDSGRAWMNDKPGHRLISRFQAGNVAQDRLTFQPSNSFGLFRRGQASLPVRGQGLPDLVFSETRFMNDHQDGKTKKDDSVNTTSQEPSKENRAKSKEAEVAEFFIRNRVPLQEKCANADSNPTRSRHSKDTVSWSPTVHTASVRAQSPRGQEQESQNRATRHDTQFNDGQTNGRSTTLGVQAAYRSYEAFVPTRPSVDIGQLKEPAGLRDTTNDSNRPRLENAGTLKDALPENNVELDQRKRPDHTLGTSRVLTTKAVDGAARSIHSPHQDNDRIQYPLDDHDSTSVSNLLMDCDSAWSRNACQAQEARSDGRMLDLDPRQGSKVGPSLRQPEPSVSQSSRIVSPQKCKDLNYSHGHLQRIPEEEEEEEVAISQGYWSQAPFQAMNDKAVDFSSRMGRFDLDSHYTRSLDSRSWYAEAEDEGEDTWGGDVGSGCIVNEQLEAVEANTIEEDTERVVPVRFWRPNMLY